MPRDTLKYAVVEDCHKAIAKEPTSDMVCRTELEKCFESGAKYERDRIRGLVEELDRVIRLTIESVKPKKSKALLAELLEGLNLDMANDRTAGAF